MKNIILLILFLIITFILNIVFYYNSSYYRTFLRWLKNEETTIVKTWEVGRDDLVNIKDKIERAKKSDKKNIKEEILKQVQDDNKDLEVEKPTIKEVKKEVKQEIKLWKNYKEILNKFRSYNLEQLTLNTNLFDITNEYPEKYFEYYSRDFTLYFFPGKDYDEILDIFKVLKLDLPISINQTNKFWDKSFYINLAKNIDDEVVRIVIKSKSVVFWLKMKKTEYKNIVNILKTIK